MKHIISIVLSLLLIFSNIPLVFKVNEKNVTATQLGHVKFFEEDISKHHTRIASFNALHLGWDNDKDYKKMASIINNFDLVGIEEVMSPKGLEEVVNILNEVSTSKWSYHISNKKVGRSTYKEYYGYIYNDSVDFICSNGFYPDKNDLFERDPYGATFKIGKVDFTYVLLHSIFGDSKEVRMKENSNLDKVYNYYQNNNKIEDDIIIGGDFNLSADYPAFDLTKIDKINYALNPVLKTSIGNKGLVSAYDNIFYSKHTKEIISAGAYDFTNSNFPSIRKTVSDHIPVFIVLDTSEDDDGIGAKIVISVPKEQENIEEPSDIDAIIEKNTNITEDPVHVIKLSNDGLEK
jgi:endonuclease/exonuclease/phosphatase family metal-dependent hydrolase